MQRVVLVTTVFCALLFSVPVEARHGAYGYHERGAAVHRVYDHRSLWSGHLRKRWAGHVRHCGIAIRNCTGARGQQDRYAAHYTMGNRGQYSTLPAPCHVAASMGGPCGCWAAFTLLGVLDHVWHGINLWLADDWLRFPRTDPAPGTAAVWPHRHVAPVLAVHNDGTVTVRDSWAVHRVRVAGLVFVQPPVKKLEGMRWPSGVML